ncbi:MAG: dTDP-4-dehydrorhamnose 3,5-epimerase [Gemmatimonadaceae bacterium]
MNVVAGSLPGVLIFEPPSFPDARGSFRELYRAPRYADAGLTETFVQDNLSRSSQHTLRGLHLQNPGAQGKLVMVLDGAVYDVAVDVRRGSPTFGSWEGFELNAENGRQAYLPPGVAHGFLVLSESALVMYKCTALYGPSNELCVRWDDPALRIEWPVGRPVLSARDAGAPSLDQIPLERLPRFEASR